MRVLRALSCRAVLLGAIGAGLLLGGCGGGDPTVTPRLPTATIPLPSVVAPVPTSTSVPPTAIPPPPPPPTATPAPPTPSPPPPSPPPGPPPPVPVLAYHLINVPEGGEFNVSADDFAAQMAWLHENDYHTLTPDQLLAALTRGAALPPHPVLITFDDNQYTPYEYAVPILKQDGFTAAFFIQTVTIGKDGFMDADQIKALADAGFTIGGHTWDHRILIQQTNEEVERQLKLSGDDLIAILGHPPEYFAYPSGLYDERIVAALQAHGYKAAFRLHDADDPLVAPEFMIPRQIIPGAWSLQDFIDNVHRLEGTIP